MGGLNAGQGNTIQGGSYDGIHVVGSSQVTIDGNSVTGNYPADIMVEGGSGITLNGNTLLILFITNGDVTFNGSATMVERLSMTAAASRWPVR